MIDIYIYNYIYICLYIYIVPVKLVTVMGVVNQQTLHRGSATLYHESYHPRELPTDLLASIHYTSAGGRP
jgi:hypothetical protein